MRFTEKVSKQLKTQRHWELVLNMSERAQQDSSTVNQASCAHGLMKIDHGPSTNTGP